VMGGRLSAATMETDLDAALDGLLGAGEAALFTPNAGDMAGRIFVVVDMDGVAGYDAGNDLLIELVNPVVPLPLGVDIFV
jgi:serralysin